MNKTTKTITEKANTEQTRNCFEPWNYVQVKSNGEVYPCCAHGEVGVLDSSTNLEDVLNGEKIKRLRLNLLRGTLDSQMCWLFSETSD